MRTIGITFIMLVSILIFAGLNYYIGLRGWQNVASFIPFLNNKVYWILFWILALSYVFVRLGGRYIPGRIEAYLNIVGAYWMAAMLYFVIILPIADLVRFTGSRAKYIPESLKNSYIIKGYSGVLLLLIVAGILVYGTINARNIKVSRYDITIPKKAENLKELHAVMLSDAHLGNIINNSRLSKMVDKINGLKPDIVLMAGDIVDEKVSPFIKQNMGDTLKQIRSKYGTYAVMGNHEYYGGEADVIQQNLEKSGVKVLRDEYVKIDGSFYLLGREDIAVESYYKTKRKTLNEILIDEDKSFPIILLDHNPRELKEAEEYNVDLQLSGHTHRGQMFPNQYFTKRMYEIDWGYLKKGNFNIIVSSGIGTWGPPIRTGNSSELVYINLQFGSK